MNLTKHLKKTLNNLAKELTEEIAYPNCGGCCVIAAEVGKYLERHIPCCLRVLDEEIPRVPIQEVTVPVKATPAHLMRTYNSNRIYFGHVLLQMRLGGRRLYWDTQGFHTNANKHQIAQDFGMELLRGELPVRVGEILGNAAKAWNKTFDRKQIPKIQSIVKKHFDALDDILQEQS